ncbi:MAG: HAMP domain-containing histidine kinase [Ruminococcus sp.]|nr:HAMP domain-containing histidine kinase [Ruminococcus sp.]
MEIFVIIVLSAAVCVLAAKLFSLKSRIGSVSKQLDDKDNTLIITQFNGDELEVVVKKINLMIENNHKAKVEISREQTALKQAIADVSHDIRTPLTSVVGYLQLAERSAENEDQRTNISIALERARYCSSLVNDFFELSIIDSKGCESVMESIDVNDMLCEMILANFPNFEAKSITPHFEDSGKPVYAHADRKMLTRVIQNLISNGIKYGRDWLDFNLTADEAVHISISNPISDHEIDTEKMFDKFYRESRSRTAGGAGIGLYICKQFVEAMDGGISASVGDGMLIITITLGIGDVNV